MSFDLTTAAEDGGLGGLIVAIIWALWTWWRNRHPSQAKSQYEK